jgi:hypothetical protein
MNFESLEKMDSGNYKLIFTTESGCEVTIEVSFFDLKLLKNEIMKRF